MQHGVGRIVLAALLMAGAGCARKSASTAEDPLASSGGLVIRRSEMRTGTLLDGLRGRMPQMQVSYPAGQCPVITFRGVRTMQGQENPSVYIDGTMMGNTCPLTQLTTADVDVVEVYTSGSSGRAGVQRNPFGVILIYRAR